MSKRSFWAQRPLVCLAAAFGLGLLTGLKGAPALWPVAAAGLICSFLLTLMLRGKHKPVMLGLCGLFFFAAVLYGGLSMRPAPFPEGKMAVEGQVSGLIKVRESDGRIQAVLRPAVVRRGDEEAVTLPAAYWTFYPGKQPVTLYDGQRVRFTGNVYRPSGQVNPYGFDFSMYLRQKGIVAGISGARDLTASSETRHQDPWLRAKISVNNRLDALFGASGALPKALLTGERQDVGEETQDAFRQAGVAHVLAISGLHVGLLMGMLLFVLKRLSVGPSARFFTIAAILFIYCRFLDFQDSVVRAAVMTLILLFGQTLKRRRDILTSLSAAFLVILVFKPSDILNVGFQLSFLAVAGIAITGDAMRAWWKKAVPRAPRFLNSIVYALIASWAAGLWTCTVLGNAFHFVSLAAFVYSPAAVALLLLLMVSYIGVLCVSLLSMPLAGLLSAFPVILTKLFLRATELAASLPCAIIRLSHIPLWWMAAAFLLLFLLSRYSLLTARRKALTLAVSFMACVLTSAATYDHSVRYTQLSLGNADSAVIEDGDKTYMIDAGEHGGDLASYLLSKGRSIDTLFITHLHTDHIGGVEQLLRAHVPIREIALPDGAKTAGDISKGLELLALAERADIPVRNVGAGDEGGAGRVRYSILWPYQGKARPGLPANDLSMAIRWELEGLTLLTTGDLSAMYEHYAAVPAMVLKAAHHGAKGATGERFLNVVSPDIVLVSDDGSPRARALDNRLKGKTVYHTADTGALTLAVTGDKIEIRRFLTDKGADNESQ